MSSGGYGRLNGGRCKRPKEWGNPAGRRAWTQRRIRRRRTAIAIGSVLRARGRLQRAQHSGPIVGIATPPFCAFCADWLSSVIAVIDSRAILCHDCAMIVPSVTDGFRIFWPAKHKQADAIHKQTDAIYFRSGKFWPPASEESVRGSSGAGGLAGIALTCRRGANSS